MRTAVDILTLFESRMAELGMSQSQLEAKAFGKPGNTAIQSLKKGAGPSFERVADMARALGLELYLGMPRHAGMAESESETDFHNRNSGPPGYLQIPWTRPGLSQDASPIALKAKWMEDQALVFDRLSAMLPDVSLVDGVDPARTVAIIEASAPRRGTGQLWCLDDHGKTVLARIAWVAEGFVIMPPRVDQAPRVVRTTDPGGPTPLGRVACLAVITPG